METKPSDGGRGCRTPGSTGELAAIVVRCLAFEGASVPAIAVGVEALKSGAPWGSALVCLIGGLLNLFGVFVILFAMLGVQSGPTPLSPCRSHECENASEQKSVGACG